MMAEVYAKQREDDYKDRITAAYLTAMWGRVKKLPNLKKLLGEVEDKPAMTNEQMLAMVRALNKTMGGKEV